MPRTGYITFAVLIASLIVLGCGRGDRTGGAVGPTEEHDVSVARLELDEAAAAELAWDPAMIIGGEMLADEQQFRAYVRRAEIVGRGTLTEWDGQKGMVLVESLLAGSLPEEGGRSVPLIYSGGLVRAETGDDVLFLLAHKKRELQLHSFCAAAGLFPFSEQLAGLVGGALAQEPRAAQ